jgi:uncharacterized protein YydD (DUF2326 family)
MHIKKLYTEPETIEPINFTAGVNLILGERDETSSKNNGVGKSLCIEFLNFALLKRKSESRVAKIPKQTFDPDTLICVDLEVAERTITIKRSISDSERPTVYSDGKKEFFINSMTPRLFCGPR